MFIETLEQFQALQHFTNEMLDLHLEHASLAPTEDEEIEDECAKCGALPHAPCEECSRLAIPDYATLLALLVQARPHCPTGLQAEIFAALQGPTQKMRRMEE